MKLRPYHNPRTTGSAASMNRMAGVRETTSGKRHGFNLEDACREFNRAFDRWCRLKHPELLDERLGEFNGSVERSAT